MKKLLTYLRAPAVIAVSTFILIMGSNLLALGAFGVTSVVGAIGVSLALTVAAYVLFYCIAVAVCVPLRLSSPGTLLQTLFGIVTGSLAIWLVGLALPGTILLDGLLAAVPYAIANTALIWLLAAVSGNLRKDLTFLPTR